MDLLKLTLAHTETTVGNGWHSYDVVGNKVEGLEAVLIKSDGEYPKILEVMILQNTEVAEQQVCLARILDMGVNKINVIKAVRDATAWGLKESKDWVEAIPHTLTPKDGLSKPTLSKLVKNINEAGGKAQLVIGKHCDTCELRFRCFTER